MVRSRRGHAAPTEPPRYFVGRGYKHLAPNGAGSVLI